VFLILEARMSEKEQLLDGLHALQPAKHNITLRELMLFILLSLLLFLLLLPKIYLSAAIYYKSREIAKLQRELKTLNEEHRVVSENVEMMRFKNQILDTMF